MSDVTLRETPLEFSSDLSETDGARKTDTLNLLPYAEALRDFIHECETPMTIGIQGDWGIGRTSLMNMLRGIEGNEPSGLLNSGQCKVINFDSWPYSQFDRVNNLAVTCLHALSSKLGVILEQETAIDCAELQAVMVAANRKLLIVRQLLRDDTQQPDIDDPGIGNYVDISDLMLGFRCEFKKLVSLWAKSGEGRRVVVFIDDLDRIQPLRAFELLEAIKNFIDVPGCVFVMALDYQVVQKGLVEKLGRDLQKTSGKAFYDQMIQLPFVVPTTSYRLDEFIINLLVKAGLPCVSSAGCDDQSRQFFLDITRFTVGRNPRSIKRVINYTKLLERIHRLNSGRQSTDAECKILYALVSMQIAWPELFQYFIRDPSVDTIASLLSWDYLEILPEAAGLFERSGDRELVKNSISAYFDTLFSLLDANDDGQIDTRELQPVLKVMEMAKITSIDSHERPRDWFLRRVRENNTDGSPLIASFLENVFMKSAWYLGTEIKYRKASHRYITLVHNRRQIGTLISLKSNPMVFRLAKSPEMVMKGLKEYWNSKHSVKKESIVLVRNTFGSEASLTGFGDTLVDFSKMTHMPSTEAIKLLNALYRIVTV